MRLLLLAGAVLAFGCKKDPKECAALLDKTEARITDELRWTAASSMVGDHLEIEKRDAPHAAMAAYPFEPGLAFHIDTEDGALDPSTFRSAVTSEACRHKGTPLRVYLVARPTTSAAQLADRVAWLEAVAAAWKKPIEILMPVKLPAEVRHWDWPEGTSSDVKAFGKAILDAPEGDDRIKRLQEKIRLASAGCSAIAKRTQEAADAPYWDNALHYAMPKGLRDCGCNGVDAHDVIGLYHIFDITSSDVGWVRLSATQGAPLPPGATVGELVAGAKADAKSTLRVPNATLPEVKPPACDEAPATVQLHIDDHWEKLPVKYGPMLDEIDDQLARCVEQYPLERSAIADMFIEFGGSLKDPGEGEVTLTVRDRTQAAYDLEQCMRMRPQLENQEVGFARVELYVAGKQ